MAGLIQCVVCLSCCGLLPVFIYGSVVVYGAEAKTQCSTKFALQYVDEIGLCNIQCVWRTRKYVHLEMKRFTLRLTPFTPELHILFYYFQVQCRHLAHGPVLGLEVLPRARLRGNLHGRLWGVAGEYPEERTDGGVKGKVREYVVS